MLLSCFSAKSRKKTSLYRLSFICYDRLLPAAIPRATHPTKESTGCPVSQEARYTTPIAMATLINPVKSPSRNFSILCTHFFQSIQNTFRTTRLVHLEHSAGHCRQSTDATTISPPHRTSRRGRQKSKDAVIFHISTTEGFAVIDAIFVDGQNGTTDSNIPTKFFGGDKNFLGGFSGVDSHLSLLADYSILIARFV
jgi:hypothetical protein